MKDRKQDRHKYKVTTLRFTNEERTLLWEVAKVTQQTMKEVLTSALKEYANTRSITVQEQ
jgi:hypothetical protein